MVWVFCQSYYLLSKLSKINCKKIRLKIYWVANDFFFLNLMMIYAKLASSFSWPWVRKHRQTQTPLYGYRCVNSQSKINIFCISNGPLNINKPKGFSPSLSLSFVHMFSLSLSLFAHTTEIITYKFGCNRCAFSLSAQTQRKVAHLVISCVFLPSLIILVLKLSQQIGFYFISVFS